MVVHKSMSLGSTVEIMYVSDVILLVVMEGGKEMMLFVPLACQMINKRFLSMLACVCFMQRL